MHGLSSRFIILFRRLFRHRATSTLASLVLPWHVSNRPGLSLKSRVSGPSLNSVAVLYEPSDCKVFGRAFEKGFD